MDTLPLHDPSVLIVESHPRFYELLPRTLRGAMPGVTFDVAASADDGLSRLEAGQYHAVISDVRSTEASDYSLLRHSQALSCPVPFLVSEKSGDGVAVGRALAHGAFDMIRHSLRGRDAADIIKRAFWMYELRLTIHNRKQRLDEFRLRHATTMMNTTQAAANLVERTIQKIQEADLVCERTIQQIETSVLVLEQICLQAETEARDCAMRVARLL